MPVSLSSVFISPQEDAPADAAKLAEDWTATK